MTPIVVFPLCSRDVGLARIHSRWIRKMGHRNAAHAIVYIENGTSTAAAGEILENVAHAFRHVTRRSYPKLERFGWPQAPNQLFQMVANSMAKQCMPWLWFEPDAVALKPDWADLLFAEYARAGQPFMGVHVEQMDHVNGTAIYPHNSNQLLPSAMRAGSSAWDYDCGPEMKPHTHDAGKGLMQHVWTMTNGRFVPVGGGETPCRITVRIAESQIRKSAAMVHRIKDDSLVRLLLSGEFKP